MAVINLIVLFTFFAFVMLAIGILYKKEYPGGSWLVYLAGAFLVILGVYIIINGIGRTEDWLTVSIGILVSSVGLISILVTGLNVIVTSNKEEDF